MDNLMKNKVMCSRLKQIDLKNKLSTTGALCRKSKDIKPLKNILTKININYQAAVYYSLPVNEYCVLKFF